MGASRGLSGHALSAIKMNLNEFKKNGIHLNDYLGVPKNRYHIQYASLKTTCICGNLSIAVLLFH